MGLKLLWSREIGTFPILKKKLRHREVESHASKATQLLRGQDKMSPLQSALNPLCPFAAHTCSRLLTAGWCFRFCC